MRKLGLFITTLTLLNTTYAENLTLNSNNLINLSPIPIQYTCDGKNLSPDFNWDHAPKNTQSYTLIVSDPDAPNGTFYHWVIFNIPKSTTSLLEGEKNFIHPIIVGKNSWNNNTYKGPCPPKGSEHRYIFSLYALDTSLNLNADADAEAVTKAMQNHVLGETEIKATFGH